MVRYKDFKIIFDSRSESYTIIKNGILKDFTLFKDAKNWIDDYIDYKNEEEAQEYMQEFKKKKGGIIIVDGYKEEELIESPDDVVSLDELHNIYRKVISRITHRK